MEARHRPSLSGNKDTGPCAVLCAITPVSASDILTQAPTISQGKRAEVLQDQNSAPLQQHIHFKHQFTRRTRTYTLSESPHVEKYSIHE